MYTAPMESEEKSVAEVRSQLAEVINEASVRGRITYITNRSRRVAAIVPVPVAEAHEARGGEND